MRLEHTNITVNNIDESAAFYEAVLGFERRWEGQANGDIGPVRAIHVGRDNIYFSLFEAEREGKAPRGYGAVGVNHVALEVDDLASYRDRLNTLGVAIHLEADYEPGERIYFFDPNGVEIELVSYR